jgi:Raf kinase inhibitor-like YbhB/YbcL family protein
MRRGVERPLIILTFAFVAGMGLAAAQQNNPPGGAPLPPALKLTSPAFQDGGVFPEKYSCVPPPGNTSPPLEWSGVPDGTASFVLITHDLEGHPEKTSADVLHWMVWNIPGSVRHLPEGVPPSAELPDGTRQGKNVTGAIGYRGPCSRSTSHHYTFELFALDQKPDVPVGATRAELLKAMEGHVLTSVSLIGLFHR